MSRSRIRPAHPFLRQPCLAKLAQAVLKNCTPRRAPHKGWPAIYIPQERAFLTVNYGVAFLVASLFDAFEVEDYPGVYRLLESIHLKGTAQEFAENLAVAGLLSL